MSKPEVERQKSPNLGFWGRIGLESLWIFCKFFSILPYWFRYYVVEPAVFGALRLLRYRYRVVTENLRNSFPEKSLEELHAILNDLNQTSVRQSAADSQTAVNYLLTQSVVYFVTVTMTFVNKFFLVSLLSQSTGINFTRIKT